jgi:triosephosphate isomerase
MARKPFIGGNWKMNTCRASAQVLARNVATALSPAVLDRVNVAVFPPFPYLLTVVREMQHHGTTVRTGAQDVFFERDGAFTGEVSAAMLHDCDAGLVIIGHSERRHVIGETDETIARKLAAALEAKLDVILCVGETLDQRRTGRTDAINEGQLRSALTGIDPALMEQVTVAYEPVWAIGTGHNATDAQAQTVHKFIRGLLEKRWNKDFADAVRIQYGGSVKPDNAPALMAMPDIDGALVGGACLDAVDFAAIVQAAAGVAVG